MLLTPDLNLIHAIYQVGEKGYYIARRAGVRADHLFDEAKPIFALMEEMVAKGRLPSPPEIQMKTGHTLGEICPDPIDVTLAARHIVKRALTMELHNKLANITSNDAINVDPFVVRDKLNKITYDTAWSYGEPYSINSREAIDDLRARYNRAKTRGNKLLGLSSPWPTVDRASLGVMPGELTVIFAKRKVGKSLSPLTPMTCPVSGQMVTLGELIKRGASRVLSWEKNAPIHVKTASEFIDSGVKDCLKITWKSGRSIIAAKTHPFRTPGGWIEADKLQVGHHVASAALVPEPQRPEPMEESEIKTLAYLIADGGCTGGSTPTWAKQDSALVEDFAGALSLLGCRLNPREPGGYTVVTTGSKHRNPVVDLLKHHQLAGKKSVEKEIPQAIFSLPNEQLALFIDRLWSSDGGAHQGSKVRYYSGSKRLVEQLQHLLLRFGVVSFFRVSQNWKDKTGETRPHYALTIAKHSIDAFKQHCPLLGDKSAQLEAVTYGGGSGESFLLVDELKDELFAQIDARPELLARVKELSGHNYSFGKSSFVNYATGRLKRKLFKIFCEVYDSPLRWVLDSNIHWDPIVSIEDAGKHHCYDLTIPETECYVANDMIVHNSWILFAWLHHIWKNDLKPGENLLLISMEMTKIQCLQRLACIDLKFSWNDFREGKLVTAEEKRLWEWCDTRLDPSEDQANILIYTSQQVKEVDDMKPLIAEHRPKCVGVDAFYILGKTAGRTLHERVLGNVQDLKLDIALEFEVGTLVSTQLKGTIGKDTLEADSDDAMGAKAIGDYADVTRGLFADQGLRDANQRLWKGMEAREFLPKDVRIHFNLDRMDFSEIEELRPGEGGSEDKSGGKGPPKPSVPRPTTAEIMKDAKEDEDTLYV